MSFPKMLNDRIFSLFMLIGILYIVTAVIFTQTYEQPEKSTRIFVHPEIWKGHQNRSTPSTSNLHSQAYAEASEGVGEPVTRELLHQKLQSLIAILHSSENSTPHPEDITTVQKQLRDFASAVLNELTEFSSLFWLMVIVTCSSTFCAWLTWSFLNISMTIIWELAALLGFVVCSIAIAPMVSFSQYWNRLMSKTGQQERMVRVPQIPSYFSNIR
jgi:hypothetical protein